MNKQLETIQKEKEYFSKKFKKEHQKILNNKNNEILQLQTKVAFLLNKIKFLENKIYMSSFKDDIENENKQSTIFQNKDLIKTKTARVASARTKFLKKEKEKNQYNSLYLMPKSKTKNKRFIIRNLSSSFINQSNIDNDTYRNKRINNSSLGERINNFIFNINENTSNKGSLDKVIINYSSNNKTINREKIKVQKKLAEYRNLIDKKLNELKSNKPHQTNKVKNSFIKLKLFDKEGKHISSNCYNNSVTNLEKIRKKVKSYSNKSQRNINKIDKFKIS